MTTGAVIGVVGALVGLATGLGAVWLGGPGTDGLALGGPAALGSLVGLAGALWSSTRRSFGVALMLLGGAAGVATVQFFFIPAALLLGTASVMALLHRTRPPSIESDLREIPLERTHASDRLGFLVAKVLIILLMAGATLFAVFVVFSFGVISGDIDLPLAMLAVTLALVISGVTLLTRMRSQ